MLEIVAQPLTFHSAIPLSLHGTEMASRFIIRPRLQSTRQATVNALDICLSVASVRFPPQCYHTSIRRALDLCM
jgi:hypothetical protein